MSYCDMHRHSLCSVFSPSAHDSCCRFPRIDARAYRVCINGCHRVRTTAPRLWLCTSLQRWLYFKSAVRGLSYPEPPGFPRWRTVQASPRVPAALLRPHQPTSAEPVLLLPYSPGASPSRFASGHCFHFMTGRYTIFSCVSPCPVRPAPRPHRVCLMGSKGSLQTLAPVATWRALLEAPRYGRDWIHVAAWIYRFGEPMCPFGRVYSAAWRAASCGLVCRRNRMRQPAERACSGAGSRPISRVLRLCIAQAPEKSRSISM
jgi:hypothetical protein